MTDRQATTVCRRSTHGGIMILQQLDEIRLFVLFLKGDSAVLELCVQLCYFEGVAVGGGVSGRGGREGGGGEGRTSLS